MVGPEAGGIIVIQLLIQPIIRGPRDWRNEHVENGPSGNRSRRQPTKKGPKDRSRMLFTLGLSEALRYIRRTDPALHIVLFVTAVTMIILLCTLWLLAISVTLITLRCTHCTQLLVLYAPLLCQLQSGTLSFRVWVA